jgi:hypothetical protein
MYVMPPRARPDHACSTNDGTLTEASIRKHLQTVRLVRMDLVAATIFPVPCERLRMCRSRCCRIGAKLASLPGPDGLQLTLTNQAPEIHPQSITAKQLAKKMRRIGFELDELVTGTQDLNLRSRWTSIWPRVTRLGRQLVVLGNTLISDEAAICSEPRHRLSKELRECLKKLDAEMRAETNAWMLKVMDRSAAASEPPSPGRKPIQKHRKVPKRKD